MKRLSLVVLVFARFAACDWDCDERCGEEAYDRCREGNRDRQLLVESSVQIEDDPIHNADQSASTMDVRVESPVNMPEARLRRGATRNTTTNNDINGWRRLIERRFKLKMYHEESRDYCWQGEWEDPEWCMECDGGTCSEGENLEIGRCDTDYDDDQFFVYESLPGTGGGRIKPYRRQYLCLMRTSDRQHTLEECDDANESVNERQILLDFDWDEDKFQLRPSSRDDHCLTQHHHPKSGEIIYAAECDDNCDDNTCFWEIIDERGSDDR